MSKPIREKATKETILWEQARLKKEPFMINVETWSYVVEPKVSINGKIEEEKPKQKTKKYSSKKQRKSIK